jgi:hypothetical protein
VLLIYDSLLVISKMIEELRSDLIQQFSTFRVGVDGTIRKSPQSPLRLADPQLKAPPIINLAMILREEKGKKQDCDLSFEIIHMLSQLDSRLKQKIYFIF